MKKYKVLTQQTFTNGEYEIVPIRFEDRFEIMKWRNEQIYHLRQNEPLTVDNQEAYFRNVIGPLFNEEKPSQILFTFLQANQCIGYGGLVHINWQDSHAELSFIMETEREKREFEFLWSKFLSLIEIVAFKELSLNKIYTYAFDIRPLLYSTLEKKGFKKEARLKSHCQISGKYKDVVIHSLFNKNMSLRIVESNDLNVTYRWAVDPAVRQFSLSSNKITQEIHKSWFYSKLHDENCIFYIAEINETPVGSIRFDVNSEGSAHISYLMDSRYHGKGLGSELLRLGIELAKSIPRIECLFGDVLLVNEASIRIFENLGFVKSDVQEHVVKYKLIIE